MNRTDDGRTACMYMELDGELPEHLKNALERVYGVKQVLLLNPGVWLTPGSGCEGTGQLRRKKGAVQVSRERGCREDSRQGRLCLYWIRKI